LGPSPVSRQTGLAAGLVACPRRLRALLTWFRDIYVLMATAKPIPQPLLAGLKPRHYKSNPTGLNRLRKKSLSSLKSAVMLSLSGALTWRFLGLCQTVFPLPLGSTVFHRWRFPFFTRGAISPTGPNLLRPRITGTANPPAAARAILFFADPPNSSSTQISFRPVSVSPG